MQFKLRDLLYLTTLIAIHMACLSYVIQSSSIPSQYAKKNAAAGLVGMAIGALVFMVIMEVLRKKKLNELKPDRLIFKCPIPWKLLLINLSLLLLLAIIPLGNYGAFYGGSIVFIGNLFLTFLHSDVHLGEKGAVHLYYLIPWKNVWLINRESGELRIQLGNTWFAASAQVPQEYREQVQELYNDYK